MKLRKENMKPFEDRALAAYENDLAEFLQEQFPDAKAVPIEDLRPAVGAQIQRARAYGLTTERQIALYVLVAWTLGQEFDRDLPAARATLESPRMSPDDKADWLARHTQQMLNELEGED